MATRTPDSPREAGDVNRGAAGDGTPQGGRGRMDEVTGRMGYAQSQGPEATARRTGGRDYYREALARASRRGPGEDTGYRGGARGMTEYESRRDSGDRSDEARARGEPEYGARPYEQLGDPRAGRDEEERGYGYRDEEYRGRMDRPSEGRGADGRPVESGSRGGKPLDMDEMARRYHTDMRFDREALEDPRYRMRGDDTRRWENRGYAVHGPPRERRRWEREPLTAGEVMTRSPRTLRPDHTLRDAARLMREENVGIVPVVDGDGRLLGVVTDRDIVVRAIHEDRVPSQTHVGDLMSEDLEVVTPDDSIHEVIELMGRKQVRRIPVVERDNRLVGIIAIGDIATRADYDEELQQAFERISSRRSFWRRFFS